MKKQTLGIITIVFIFLGAMAFENYEDKHFRKNNNLIEVRNERLKVFEYCMTRNNYEYSDINCELCYDSALMIVNYTKWEKEIATRMYSDYRKWCKRNNIAPVSKEVFMRDNL